MKQTKFLVFSSCLLKLLEICPICTGLCSLEVIRCKGTCIFIHRQCINGHQSDWTSQPLITATLPAGNMAVAGGILFSGASPVKSLHLLKLLQVPAISIVTYGKLQSSYLAPAVRELWGTEQRQLLQARAGTEVPLGGDGRCCSPGHTAKYGSYTLMDLATCKILDTQLIQVRINKVSSYV